MSNLLNTLKVSREASQFQVFSYGKLYPSGDLKLFVYSSPTLKKQAGLESPLKYPSQAISKVKTPQEMLLNQERSIRRTRTVISDLTLSNDFDMFATFTFSKDRQNIDGCRSKMSNWLKSQSKKHGHFDYLIVPEFHKDNKSIHFHALFKNYKGNLIDSNKKINGRTAYNISSYQSGFSTLVKIDDIAKVSSYVRKYITKSMPLFKGRKRYWSSKGLKRPQVLYNLTPTGLMRPVYNSDLYTLWIGLPTVDQLKLFEVQAILSVQTNEGNKRWPKPKPKTFYKSSLTSSPSIRSQRQVISTAS